MNNIPPQTRRAPAFTIMELITVAIIIGVLAAIALPSYRIQMLKMKNQEAVRILMTLWEAQKEYYRENGDYYFSGIVNGIVNINIDLPLQIPTPKYFTDLIAWEVNVSCTQGPKSALAYLYDIDFTYMLWVLEDGRVVCLTESEGCSASLCKKMGFKDDW